MFWKLEQEPDATPFDPNAAAGRYVLHRHTDAQGEHLDLRLECDGYLIGWRIDADDLGGEPYATEKAPHATRWLDEAQSQLASGRYAVERNTPAERVLILETGDGTMRLRFTLDDGMTPTSIRGLLADGTTARNRAIERLCGLGRELDGAAFDADLWRKSLRGLSLDEIHAQLRTFEMRFDRKYPPQPVSRPERLDDDNPRAGVALEIARSTP